MLSRILVAAVPLLALVGLGLAQPPAQTLSQEPNTWVKRSPLPGGPTSPGMGYEASFGYDPRAKKLIRWAGHNQGGGGEQNAETWVYDPATSKWEIKEPNTAPPGVCCAQQNVFDPVGGRFLRFAGFSGNHGWQWFREIYMNNNAVWSYDLATNTWRDLRTVPAPRLSPLRCASWDDEHQVVVIFGGEGSTEGTLVFDPYNNTWTRKTPKIQPDFRSSGNMAYDAKRKLHILFGSQFSDDPHTWAYDLAKNEWHDMKPAVQPPTDRNDAVLAYDPNSGMIVASVRVIDKLDGKEIAEGHFETWLYDGDKNTWKQMKPATEPPGAGNRRRIMVAIPDQNVVLMENYSTPKNGDREQQMWTYRVAEKAAAIALPPTNRKEPRVVEAVVASVLGAREVQLSWPAGSKDIAGYIVERAPVEVYSEDEILRLKKDTPPLKEPSVGALRAIGAFERLTKEPIKEAKYVDRTVDLTKPAALTAKPIWSRPMRADQLDAAGKPYRFAVFAYRVRAVNSQGSESGPSPYALTIPSAPQWLFSKEDGPKCQLKWSANPEQKVAAYRVYRMESPRINGPGQKVTRVTADPIAEPRFSDAEAGKVTRRYWIVAVDALGQEGYPSALTWFEREYKRYYTPFVGGWHQ